MELLDIVLSLVTTICAMALAAYLLYPRDKENREEEEEGGGLKPLLNFNWKTAESKRYRPYKPGIYKSSLSLTKASIQDWIEVDKNYLALSKTREIYFDEFTKELSYCNKNYEFALREFYDTVVQYLMAKYPTCFYIRGEEEKGYCYNSIREEYIPTSSNNCKNATEILRILAVTINEDFLILLKKPKTTKKVKQSNKPNTQKETEDYYLRSCCVCFPSGFVPTSTMCNKSIDTIHKFVPEYPNRMRFAMNKFFNRIEPGQFHVRVNWFLMAFKNLLNLGDERYYEPFWGTNTEDDPYDEVTGEINYDKVDYSKIFIRSERQILTKIDLGDEKDMVVMVVKTYKYPLSEIKSEETNSANLVGAIEGIEGVYADYKGKHEWYSLIVPYLKGDVTGKINRCN